MIDLNVALVDSKTQKPVGGAVVRIDTLPNLAIFPPTRTVNQGGPGTCNFYHGPPIPSVQVVVTVDADGYVPWTNGDTPLIFGSQTVDLTVPLVASFNQPGAISRSAFRALNPRGNCGGMVLPGLNLSTHDALFDPMIPWYSEDVQQAIFEAKQALGLNVIGLCSWADYHGSEFNMPIRYDWVNDADGPQQARAYCVKLRRLGFVPIFWLLGDRVSGDSWDASGGSCDGGLDIIRRMLPAIKDVIGAAIPGFELRGPGDASPYSAAQYWRMLILMNDIAPDLYKFGHFTLENSAGSSHSPVDAQDPWHGDEIAFWAKTDWPKGSTRLDGFFYQAPTDAKLFDGTGQWKDRWQECLDRIGPDKMWHVDVDCCWGEAGWYNVTRGNNTQAQLASVTAEAMAMGGRFSFSG